MITRSDLMILRNVIHGAPVKAGYLAARLRSIDRTLNETTALPERRLEDKGPEYYLRIARAAIMPHKEYRLVLPDRGNGQPEISGIYRTRPTDHDISRFVGSTSGPPYNIVYMEERRVSDWSRVES